MTSIASYFLTLEEFLQSGGYVLYAIFVTALMIWFFIGERYWYFLFSEKKIEKRMIMEWQGVSATNLQFLKTMRMCRISQFRQATRKHLAVIKALTNVSILLGLLGTITGMISLFEGVALTQGSTVRVLADGVSRTIIPALAGLVVAISGFYFSSRLEQRAVRDVHRLSEHLTRIFYVDIKS